METAIAQIQSLPYVSEGLDFLKSMGLDFTGLSGMWLIIQFAVILVCILFSRFVGSRLQASFHERLRNIEGQRALLKVLVTVNKRTFWILLALVLWIAYLIMQGVTWPSRSYFVRAAASLTTAWVLISFVSRIFRNRTVSRSFAVLAWVVAALSLVGALPKVIDWLSATGFTLGDVRISALSVIQSIMLLIILLWAASLATSFLGNQIDGNAELSPSLKVLAKKIIRVLLIALAILISLGAVGIDLTALAVFSGALGIGVGLGLQKIVSNFVSGIILLLDKSIKPGDVIEIETVSGTTYGWVQTLGARYTSLRTRDGTETLVPNENFIDQSVTNWSFSDSVVRKRIPVGVSYDTDVEHAIELCVDAATKVSRVLKVPKPVCLIKGFGDNSVDLEVRFWINDPDDGVANVSSKVYLEIWKLFKEHKIEIPFPQRDLHIRSGLPDALKPK